ncbi:hypothetical protein [Enterobacter quasiroggenkampii]|uniref:hypothetical protein n=1 Tax=Enterobacter quasiroggenkampii TaxID=2497436 RepID=UPI003B97D30F
MTIKKITENSLTQLLNSVCLARDNAERDDNRIDHSFYYSLAIALEELQEFRKAASKPVGWTDEQELRSVDKDGCGYIFKANPVSPHSDPRRVIMVYAAPPAQIVADLCAAIEALLDMQVRMVKQTNVGASFFDGETISAMNYAPIQAKQALELAKPYK